MLITYAVFQIYFINMESFMILTDLKIPRHLT